MPNIHENPEILNFLHNYTDLGYGSYILFMLIGTALTILIQSSSATMALTLVMCANGWIGFDIAASMVLGENIGTTITANLAAMVANTTAKRAAFAHFLFNLFGVAWVLGHIPNIPKMGSTAQYQLGNRKPVHGSRFRPGSLIPVPHVFQCR